MTLPYRFGLVTLILSATGACNSSTSDDGGPAENDGSGGDTQITGGAGGNGGTDSTGGGMDGGSTGASGNPGGGNTGNPDLTRTIECGAHVCERPQICCWDRATDTGECLEDSDDCPREEGVAQLRCTRSFQVQSELSDDVEEIHCCFDEDRNDLGPAEGQALTTITQRCGTSPTLCDPLNNVPDSPSCDCQPFTFEGWLPPGYFACVGWLE